MVGLWHSLAVLAPATCGHLDTYLLLLSPTCDITYLRYILLHLDRLFTPRATLTAVYHVQLVMAPEQKRPTITARGMHGASTRWESNFDNEINALLITLLIWHLDIPKLPPTTNSLRPLTFLLTTSLDGVMPYQNLWRQHESRPYRSISNRRG
jgi:hypothetical protein